MSKKTKEQTIEGYLKSLNLNQKLAKNLHFLLDGLNLKKVSIDLFFRVFDKIPKTPQDVYKFITCPNNSAILGEFGYKASGLNKFNAYNGKSDYQDVEGKCTLGSRNSRFHG